MSSPTQIQNLILNSILLLHRMQEFHQWGRVRGSKVRMKDAQFSSKAYGTHEYKDLSIEGRVQFDLLATIQRDHKLSAYSLNAVSAHFLGALLMLD